MRLIDADKLLEDMPKNDELFSMAMRRVILEQPIVEAVPMDFHDRCMELEINKRFAAEKKRREESCVKEDHAGEKPNGDLISREGIYTRVYKLACDCTGVIDGICSDYAEGLREAARQIMEYHAADAVQVVRCKDCKCWHGGDCYRIELTSSHDFCSYGERKGAK